MNTRQFSVLFFVISVFIGAGMAIFNPVINGLAVQLPLLSASAGTLSLPLAVLGLIKLAAAASLAGVGFASILGGGATGEAADSYGYAYAEDYDHGYGRYKRSAGAYVGNKDAIFGLVSSMDMFSCGKALVCGLQAKDQSTLQQDEQLIMTLFADRKAQKSVNPNSAKAEYDLAAELGLATKNEVACRKRYSTCPYTSDEMMNALRQAQI